MKYKNTKKMEISKKIISALGTGTLLLPFIAFAQTAIPQTSYLLAFISQAQNLVRQLIPLLVGVAVVVFIWGVIRYITAGESDEKRKAGRNLMIYGIIAIFVIVSICGLVAILQELTGTTGGVIPTIPIPY